MLDEISLGEAKSETFLSEFYEKFEALVQQADKEMVKREATQAGKGLSTMWCTACHSQMEKRRIHRLF